MTPTNLPKVSIDVVPVRFLADGTVQVGLGVRAAEPFKGRLALPGVLLLGGELLNDAALRALSSKAGVPAAAVRALRQVATFDSPDRDPRGHTLSVALVAVTDPESEPEEIQWFDLADVPSLPFDHESIISSAVSVLGTRLWQDVELVRGVLGEKFPTALAHRITSQLDGVVQDKANFNRSLAANPLLKDTGRTEASGRGRPSKVWEIVG